MSGIVLVRGQRWTLDAALEAIFEGTLDEEDVVDDYSDSQEENETWTPNS